jgi:hypothetical protein
LAGFGFWLSHGGALWGGGREDGGVDRRRAPQVRVSFKV